MNPDNIHDATLTRRWPAGDVTYDHVFGTLAVGNKRVDTCEDWNTRLPAGQPLNAKIKGDKLRVEGDHIIGKVEFQRLTKPLHKHLGVDKKAELWLKIVEEGIKPE